MKGDNRDSRHGELRRWGRMEVPTVDDHTRRERERRSALTLAASIRSAHQERRRTRQRAVFGVAAAAALLIGTVGWALPALRRESGPLAQLSTWFGPASATDGSQAEDPDRTVALLTGTLTLHRGSVRQALRARDGTFAGRPGADADDSEAHAVLTGEGDVFAAGSAGATASFGLVTQTRFGSHARMAIQEVSAEEQRLILSEGEVHFRVDPERKSQVSIIAGDAQVHVTGTEFTVHVLLEKHIPQRTDVSVQRGRVLVTFGGGTRSLGAGESWSSHAGGTLPPEGALRGDTAETQLPQTQPGQTSRHPGVSAGDAQVSTEKAARLAAGGTEESARTSAGTGHHAVVQLERATAPALSTLALENELFRSALAARNSGQSARCVTLLNQLMNRHPQTPLRQDAMVARFRCLAAAGSGQTAGQAAARYLAEYPSGFARKEARELVLGKD